MARVLSFLIRYFSNYYTLHRSDLAARAAPLDPRLQNVYRGSMREWWKVLEWKTNSAVSLQKQIRLAVNWLLSLKDYMSVIMIFPYGNIKLHGGSTSQIFLTFFDAKPHKHHYYQSSERRTMHWRRYSWRNLWSFELKI